MIKTSIKYPIILILLISVGLFSSCVQHKELISFNSENNMPKQIEILNQLELTIQPNDLLKIDILSFNMDAAAPFNIDSNNRNASGATVNSQSLELFSGYFVDMEGLVSIPVIGMVNLEGMTIQQAKVTIAELVKPYLKDAVVNIRFLNFKVTVSGEVNSPGQVNLSNKRVTIFEALGMAGDLTNYANRENILIVREENGLRTYNRIDITGFDIFESPYFYLQQNDFIYIEPIKARVATVADPAQRIITMSSGFLSLLSIIIALSTN